MNQVMISKTKDYLVVKIPLQTMRKGGEADVSPRSLSAVDRAIQEGLADLEAGRFIGPFSGVKKFKAHLAKNR